MNRGYGSLPHPLTPTTSPTRVLPKPLHRKRPIGLKPDSRTHAKRLHPLEPWPNWGLSPRESGSRLDLHAFGPWPERVLALRSEQARLGLRARLGPSLCGIWRKSSVHAPIKPMPLGSSARPLVRSKTSPPPSWCNNLQTLPQETLETKYPPLKEERQI